MAEAASDAAVHHEEDHKAVLDTFSYDNRLPMWFAWATIIWGIVGMVVGVIIAVQMTGLGSTWGPKVLNQEWLGFGRLRPLHTNAVIFAFTGNAIFAGVYYALQRLLKARLWCDGLGWFHFWGWQLIIVAAAVTLPLGISTSKEYAELEWPIDIAIAAVWVAFGANMIGTIFKRRERHLYVAIWFFLATFLGIAMLHIVNSLAVPAGILKSYSVFAGQQDALVQWWYGHNAVAFFLTTPILGLMYYYLPKAAGRPVFSYRLSIVHFWSLVFIYIWAGPHHLLHTSLPVWAQAVGTVFSIILWAPSWGGMVNGLLTLRGAFDKVRTDPVLKFYVLSVTFYGMSTFEGPMMSLREVNALTHNTDWTIGHVHAGALGWVGFMCFGMLYWMIPKLYRTKLKSVPMADLHFWMASLGIVLYVISMYAAGAIQAAMWFKFDASGILAYPDWMAILRELVWPYIGRAVGGLLYLTGAVLCLWNLIATAKQGQPVEDETVQAPPLAREKPVHQVVGEAAAVKGNVFDRMTAFHSLVERWPFALIITASISLVIGGAFEIIPNLVQGSLTPRIETVKPYTPLELHGRDLYIREGCNSCHTQMVRTLRADTARFGDAHMGGVPAYTRAGEDIYDRPFLWGSKRTGPDLDREGLIKNNLPGWHYRHMLDPQLTSAGSIMPGYPHLYDYASDLSDLQARMSTLAGAPMYTPYSEAEITNAEALAAEQAAEVAGRLRKALSGNAEVTVPDDLEDKEIVAMIAYLERLGTDLTRED
jgi:cytochrome c oxidase cbb3-type subunit I/II